MTNKGIIVCLNITKHKLLVLKSTLNVSHTIEHNIMIKTTCKSDVSLSSFQSSPVLFISLSLSSHSPSSYALSVPFLTIVCDNF